MLSTTTWAANAQNSEITHRADLSQTPEMEVVSSISEYQPGDSIKRHFHHGIEAAYIVQGGMVQASDNPPMQLKTGASIMNLRDIPHAGFKVVGEQAIKLYTVHIVDKDKAIYEWVEWEDQLAQAYLATSPHSHWTQLFLKPDILLKTA